MAEVLISHPSERRNAAQHLARVIELYGYSVWFDYRLLAGEDFDRRMERELDAAKAVVALWCPLARESEWVLGEAQYAHEHGKLVSALLERTELPLGFQRADTIDLTVWNGTPWGYGIDRLLSGIARLVEREPQLRFNEARDFDASRRGLGWFSLAQMPLVEPLRKQEKQQSLDGDATEESSGRNEEKPSVEEKASVEEKPSVEETQSPGLQDTLSASATIAAPQIEEKSSGVSTVNVSLVQEEQHPPPTPEIIVSDAASSTVADKQPLKNQRLTSISWFLLGILIAGAAAGAVIFWQGRQTPSPVEPDRSAQSSAPSQTQAEGPPAAQPAPEPPKSETAPIPSPGEAPKQAEASSAAQPAPEPPKSEIAPIPSPGEAPKQAKASSAAQPAPAPPKSEIEPIPPPGEAPKQAEASSAAQPAPAPPKSEIAPIPPPGEAAEDAARTVEPLIAPPIAPFDNTLSKPAPAPETDCDRLAADPEDPDRIAAVAGVRSSSIDENQAAAACSQATSLYPSERRFAYQFGRIHYSAHRYVEAVDYLTKAAAAGSARASHVLGSIYEDGKVGGKDYAKAEQFYLQAARAGHTHAMCQLGVLYETGGPGVAKNYSEAAKWYRLAANAGNAKAMYELGAMYEHDWGVGKDMDQARRYYQMGADRGDAKAKAALARLGKADRK